MRIVILRPLKLGDFLTGVPAYRAVRRAFPRAHIILAAPAVLAPLVDLLDGALDELADTQPLTPLPQAARGADLAIDLHGKGPESYDVLVEAGSRKIIAFRAPDAPPYDPHEHEVARWCRLLEAAGITGDAQQLDLRVPTLQVPRRLHGATLIHPGAASESRCWPVDRWAAVARAERSRGSAVLITGMPEEKQRARAIAQAAGVPSTHVFAGRTNLRELAALVAASGRVVCGDTGVAHLATAFARPSLVLFGPTPPSAWGPPKRPYHRVLWNGTTGDPHGTSVDEGLLGISAARVIFELGVLSSISA